MKRPAYQDLYFGKSDSKNELNENRDELLRSFVDLDGAVEQILGGEKSLIHAWGLRRDATSRRITRRGQQAV